MAITKGTFSLPREIADDILGKASNGSAFMQAGTKIELSGNGKDFITIGEMDANWVQEGAVKPATQPSISVKSIDPYVLVSKFVVSEQFLEDTDKLFDALVEQGAPGLAKAFDRTVAGYKAAPGVNFDSLGGVTAVEVTDYKTLVAAYGAAEANGNANTAVVATRSYLASLNGLTYADGRPVVDYGAKTLLGLPVYTFKTAGGDAPQAWVGDFSRAKWGDVSGIHVKISTDATVDGVSLFDTNSVAVRIEARFGHRVENLADYARLVPAAE